MHRAQPQILIYGYGNPGRQDDGLGVICAEKLSMETLPDVRIESNYQLNIEDSLIIAERDIVIFIDAAQTGHEAFTFYKLTPAKTIEITTHAMSPCFVLALCQELYNKNPPAYMLEIRGYEWEMKETISHSGNRNLAAAFDFLRELLIHPTINKIQSATTKKKMSPTSNTI